MNDALLELVEAALRSYGEPHLGCDLYSAGAVRSLRVDQGRVDLAIELGFPAKSQIIALTSALQERLAAVPGVKEVSVQIGYRCLPHRVQAGQAPLPGVKNVLAIASGKGGVGKSTVAVNLALALAQEGAQVGILDADIYGPSLPRMLGISGPPTVEGQAIEPQRAFGLQAMSIGLLVEEDTPVIWRGPMATSALEQLLRQTRWQDLDYLIVDLPPGTGDIHLTLVQRIPVAGAVIVTTPQPIAWLDAMKGLRMFEKVKVPVLGIVENMSVYRCPQCGHQEAIFGQGGGEELAQKSGVPLLGKLPLDLRVREGADLGQPIVVADPESALAQTYAEIARRMAARLALQPKDLAGKFPKFVVEGT
nr:Na+/H+ antiporter [uncultured Gammaproteobacteria bacterium]